MKKMIMFSFVLGLNLVGSTNDNDLAYKTTQNCSECTIKERSFTDACENKNFTEIISFADGKKRLMKKAVTTQNSAKINYFSWDEDSKTWVEIESTTEYRDHKCKCINYYVCEFKRIQSKAGENSNELKRLAEQEGIFPF